jgi:hypothetical protein
MQKNVIVEIMLHNIFLKKRRSNRKINNAVYDNFSKITNLNN